MISGYQIRAWSWKSGKAAADPACTRPGSSRRFSAIPRLRSRRASGFADAGAARWVMLAVRPSKLYIGPRAFQKQSPKILDVIRDRAANIVNERNPDHPTDMGPINPA
jgi:hypothetical protein